MESVSAVVVTYNSEAVIGACLDALRPFASVIVIDNASSDGTVHEAVRRPWVQVITKHENLGFAAAVNQGVALTVSKFILVINPDVVVHGGIEQLAAASEQHGIAAGKLIGEDGQPQRGFNIRRLPQPITLMFEALGINRAWKSNPVNRRYRALDVGLDTVGPVEQPAGAFLMVRRDVFEDIGGFDEAFYPLWFEDVDFCARARAAGYEIWYEPEAQAFHSGAHSISSLSDVSRTTYWYASLLKYAAKHFAQLDFRAVCGAVVAGSVLRMTAGVFQERSWKPVTNYNRVIRLALAGAWAGRTSQRPEELDQQWRGMARSVASHPAQR